MTADATDYDDYERAPPDDGMESFDGKLPPVAGYGRLRLLVNQKESTCRGEIQHLMLESVVHVPGLRHYNLISIRTLAKTLDALIRIYPAVDYHSVSTRRYIADIQDSTAR